MTDLESALLDAWSDFADAEIEHDKDAAERAWARIQQRFGEE